MLNSEKMAIAAHLHVLLRRKTGRVTDTEWLASNKEYATEIVRFARARAAEDEAPELAEWADKLETALQLSASGRKREEGSASAPAAGAEEGAETQRYVRGIR